MNIKSVLMSVSLVIATVLTGCKTVPTEDQMTTIGKMSGYTAAFVLDKEVKVDNTTRNAIIAIISEAEKYIPTTNETFATTWTPIAKRYLDNFKDEYVNPIPEATKEKIVTSFSYIVGLLDQYVEKRGIKQYQNLTEIFIHSFCDSFLISFKPANTQSLSAPKVEFDEFTYETMMKSAGLK